MLRLIENLINSSNMHFNLSTLSCQNVFFFPEGMGVYIKRVEIPEGWGLFLRSKNVNLHEIFSVVGYGCFLELHNHILQELSF